MQVYWVSTHARIVAYFADEQPDVIRSFNHNMMDYVSTYCKHIGVIDVYNMTEHLIETDLKNANMMTYDKVHWGRGVNLIKSHIILNTLLA
jgi:hypothetical protein